MTTITIERELIEQALNALTLPCDRWNRQQFMIVKAATKSLEAALAAPATAPEQMPLERDCICHQDLHIDGYSGGAAPEGLYGALWVVVEGVGKKYVLADQSSEPKDMLAPATAQAAEIERLKTESEERLQNCAALVAEVERLRKDAERYQWLAEYLVSDDESYDDAIVAATTVKEVDSVIDNAMKGTS